MKSVEELLRCVAKVPCPLCGASKPKFARTMKGWRVETCAVCGMSFANPMPTAEALAEAYALPGDQLRRYFQSSEIDEQVLFSRSNQWQIHNANKYLGSIEKLAGGRGRIFELWCGAGVFLEAAANRGWSTAGIDPGNLRRDPEFDRRLGIYRGTMETYAWDGNAFDAVFMSSVLEHIPRPLAVLQRPGRMLRNGGVLYIAGVPNINSFTIRLGIDRYIGNHPPGHVLYFNRRTLSAMLGKADFAPVKIRCFGMPETILEAIFNRRGASYTGSYTALVQERTLRGRALDIVRSVIYAMLDITVAVSVLEACGRKAR